MAAQLSLRIDGRRSAEADEWLFGFVKHLSTPVHAHDRWATVDAFTQATQRARPFFEAAAGELERLGMNPNGGALAPRIRPAASAEPSARGVSVTFLAPEPPVGFAVLAGNTTARLTWRAAGAMSIRIKRAQAKDGPFVQIAMTSGHEFVDTGLENDRPYWYTLAAVNEVGASRDTAPIGITPSASGSVQQPVRAQEPRPTEMAQPLSQRYGEDGGVLGLAETVAR